MSNEERKGFVVKDNRRFDSDGNERDKSAAKVSSSSPEPKAEPTPRPTPSVHTESPDGPSPSDHKGERSIDFSSFVVSLGTQALMQLGMIKPPEGMPLEIDPIGAKQTIDILDMLEKRTKGNLTDDETKLLTEVLHSLRMSFVKATSSPKK